MSESIIHDKEALFDVIGRYGVRSGKVSEEMGRQNYIAQFNLGVDFYTKQLQREVFESWGKSWGIKSK